MSSTCQAVPALVNANKLRKGFTGTSMEGKTLRDMNQNIAILSHASAHTHWHPAIISSAQVKTQIHLQNVT